MIRLIPHLDWQQGRYVVVAASATAELEWLMFVKRNPAAAQKVWERLSNCPLSHQPRRQYPLRGIVFHPFWELEATGDERIWYAVDEVGLITIVAARNDIHTAPKLVRILKARRNAYDAAVAEVLRVAIKDDVDAPLRIPEWAIRRR